MYFSLEGSQTGAKIFTNNIDERAISQIQEMCNHPALKDAPIRIMPDVQPGSGCVVGFTAPITDKVVTNWVGNDIGCGILF